MHGKLVLPFSCKIRKPFFFINVGIAQEVILAQGYGILMLILTFPDMNIRIAMLGSDHKFSCAGIHDQQMSRDIKDTANIL